MLHIMSDYAPPHSDYAPPHSDYAPTCSNYTLQTLLKLDMVQKNTYIYQCFLINT